MTDIRMLLYNFITRKMIYRKTEPLLVIQQKGTLHQDPEIKTSNTT